MPRLLAETVKNWERGGGAGAQEERKGEEGGRAAG